MAEARYEILIPQGGIAQQAMNHLVSQVKTTTAHIEQRNVSMMGRIAPYEVLVFQAEDEPHTDSQAKSIAAWAGETANVQSILVSKQGKQGIQTWPIRNTKFQEKGPLDSGPIPNSYR